MVFNKLGLMEGAVLLYETFKQEAPCCIGKLGNVELRCLYNYFWSLHNKETPINWNPIIVQEAYINAGIFPQTEEARITFCQEMNKAVKNADIMASWNQGLGDFEDRFIKSNNTNCNLVDLQCLEPFYTGFPWTAHLKGKNVLVISPFTESIKQQYKQKHLIWSNPDILPDFNLITLYHPTSKAISGNKNPYNSWIDMVQDLCNKMTSIDFDVALIGTGASSLPLASFIKGLNKQAIHLGGALQILFGIKGKRWDEMKPMKFFFNKNWIRPSPEETPPGFQQVEGGTYW